MEAVSKIGPIYDPHALEVMQFFVPSYIPYPRLHRWVVLPCECRLMDVCFMLVACVTLG